MKRFSLSVQLFAAARDRVGKGRVDVELGEGATVAALLEALVAQHPKLATLVPQLRVAVDEEFAERSDVLREGADVALIPPVAGGAPKRFSIQSEPLSVEDVSAMVATAAHGGLVTFAGSVRDVTQGRPVVKLDYEAYVPMAEKKLAELGDEAQLRWPGISVAVAHRVGSLEPGELAVVVAVSAPHRKAAFEACAHLIERLKADVPIWKKEHFADGEVWVGLLGPEMS